MTNKLPEVGKRYKHKGTNNRNEQIIERVGLYNDRGDEYLVCVQYYLNHEKKQITAPNNAFFVKIKDFWELYEELSTKDQLSSNPLQLNGVERAKEELRKHLNLKPQELSLDVALNFNKIAISLAQNLLNALDELNIPEKGDCGIVEYTKLKNDIEELKQLIKKNG